MEPTEGLQQIAHRGLTGNVHNAEVRERRWNRIVVGKEEGKTSADMNV